MKYFLYADENVDLVKLKHVPSKVDTLPEITEEDKNDVKIIKDLITLYITVIRNQLKDTIPKQVFNHLIFKTKDMMSAKLFGRKREQADLSRFLEENSQTKEIRDKLKKEVDSLDSCLRIIDGLKPSTETNDGFDQEQTRERKRKHRSKRVSEIEEEESIQT